MLESRPAGVGEARPRLRAVFHGARLASLFLPSVRVPETSCASIGSGRRSTWILLAVKIVAIGGGGLGLVLSFCGSSAVPSFRWRSVLVPPPCSGRRRGRRRSPTGSRSCFAPTRRSAPAPLPSSRRRSALLIGLIAPALRSRVAFVLYSARVRAGAGRSAAAGRSATPACERPSPRRGWPASPACRPSPRPAFRRSSRSTRLCPRSLETAVPALARRLVGGAEHVPRSRPWPPCVRRSPAHPSSARPLGAALGIAALLAAFALPSSHSGPASSPGFLVPRAFAAIAWLGFALLCLLEDHVAAWVLFGAFAFGGPLVGRAPVAAGAADRHPGSARRGAGSDRGRRRRDRRPATASRAGRGRIRGAAGWPRAA